MTTAVALALPFAGRWMAQNSPARRVPSHGIDILGQRYAIDFVAVDERGRTSAHWDWRSILATEPPDRFYGHGRPILAPAGGVVVAVHDGEPDHAARRSQLALIPYALSQGTRLRHGPHALAGNSVIIQVADRVFVALVHLKLGSVRVTAGSTVTVGQHFADCGNSGNSTEPHVHLQAMDDADPVNARGLPIEFVGVGLPADGAVVEAL